MELIGKIKLIEATQEVGQNNFKIRNIRIETDGQYPQVIPFQFTQDKTNELDNFSIGQFVKITFNLEGREYQDKCFLTARAWKIERL